MDHQKLSRNLADLNTCPAILVYFSIFFFAVSHTSHRIRFFSFFFFSNESKQAIPFHRRRMVDFDASEKTHSTGRAIAIRWAEQTAFRQANGG